MSDADKGKHNAPQIDVTAKRDVGDVHHIGQDDATVGDHAHKGEDVDTKIDTKVDAKVDAKLF